MTQRHSLRPALAALGIAALTAAAAAVPQNSGAHAPEMQSLRSTANALPPTMPTATARDVLPQRDPFADDPEAVARTAAAAPPPATLPGVALDLHVMDARLRAAQRAPGAPGQRVTATVTGLRPFAVVVDAAGSHILAVGDAIGGRTVAAIDAAGVRFSDGTLLALSAAHEATHREGSAP